MKKCLATEQAWFGYCNLLVILWAAQVIYVFSWIVCLSHWVSSQITSTVAALSQKEASLLVICLELQWERGAINGNLSPPSLLLQWLPSCFPFGWHGFLPVSAALLLLFALHDYDKSGRLDGLEFLRLLSELAEEQAKRQPLPDMVGAVLFPGLLCGRCIGTSASSRRNTLTAILSWVVASIPLLGGNVWIFVATLGSLS